MPDLFSPLTLGPYRLPNRVMFAPCTRCRAGAGLAPSPLNAAYYAQRAGAGLIISEATQISEQAKGYPHTPGIHTPQHVAGWKLVTDAVHNARGRIYCQLWHVGRVSHPAYQPDGGLPLSSWTAPRTQRMTLPDFSKADSVAPRMMTLEDIQTTMNDYVHAARCALEAGFDGVELHGANSYLAEQFLRDGINKRTDEYGGSIANRARFHIEAARALISVWGPERVGVRLSPSGVHDDVTDTTPKETFGYLVRQYAAMSIGYIHIMEALEPDLLNGPKADPAYEPIPVSFFRSMYDGTIITNGRMDRAKAMTYIQRGDADAVAFGTAFIANPDLPERLRVGAALNTPDPSTYYGGGEKGYTDYPFLPVTNVI